MSFFIHRNCSNGLTVKLLELFSLEIKMVVIKCNIELCIYSLNFYFVYPQKSGIYIKYMGILQKRSWCKLDQDGASMTIMHQLLRFIDS